MIVGCYTVHLYCSNSGFDKAQHLANCCQRDYKFPEEFTGETEKQCLAVAKKSGWKITKDRDSYCPQCAANGNYQ